VVYELYEKSGCIPGRDLENWLEAERIVLSKYGLLEQKDAPIIAILVNGEADGTRTRNTRGHSPVLYH
jgi:hypothetical protein